MFCPCPRHDPLMTFCLCFPKRKAPLACAGMQHNETIVVSPVALRGATESVSPTTDFATPRTSLRALRRQSRSRPENPTNWLDESPVRIIATAALTPAGKSFPDGLIRTPNASPPPTAWSSDEATEPRRLGATSIPRCDDDFFITQHMCEVMLASPPTKLSNGHVTFATAQSDDASLLKQRQVHRMQKLQFDHPALNATPQRLAGTSRGLREILNSNATTVQFMPKPPPRVS